MQKHKDALQTIRFLGVLIFLCSSLIIAFELLYVRNYDPSHTNTFEMSRNVLFVIGLAILIGAELYFRIKAQAFIRKSTKK